MFVYAIVMIMIITIKGEDIVNKSQLIEKIAAGADKVLLDVKVGNGATFSGLDQARRLARLMVNIGTGLSSEV